MPDNPPQTIQFDQPSTPITASGTPPQTIQFDPPASGGAGGSWDPLPGEDSSGVMGIGVGVAKEMMRGVQGGEKILNHVLPAEHQIPILNEQSTQESNLSQQVGGLAATGAEWSAGLEGLEGIAKVAKFAELAQKLPGAAKTMELMHKYPFLAKMAEGATKNAVVGGAEGTVKGAATGHAKEGAIGGAAGGVVGGAAGEVLGGAADALTNSHIAQGMINRSVGATKNMVRYADPSRALLEEKLPLFQSLSTEGREIAAKTKLNELKPQLDTYLQQSPVVQDWKQMLQGPIQEARQKVAKSITTTPEAKELLKKQIDALEMNLINRYPSGQMSTFEANELKHQIGEEGAEFDAKPDSSDVVKSLYTKSYAALKDHVNKTVPEMVDLNRRVSNLIALKNAAHETVLAEKAGVGPLSGFGMWRKGEAAAGHAIPTAAKVVKAIKPVLGAVGPPLGAAAGQEVMGANEPAPDITFTASNGSRHSIPNNPNAIAHAKSVDPNLKLDIQ